jgi:hypothetical protein
MSANQSTVGTAAAKLGEDILQAGSLKSLTGAESLPSPSQQMIHCSSPQKLFRMIQEK